MKSDAPAASFKERGKAMSEKGLWGAKPHDLYRGPDGVYLVIGYQPNPTVIIQRVLNSDMRPVVHQQQQHVAVGCLNAEEYSRIGPAAD